MQDAVLGWKNKCLEKETPNSIKQAWLFNWEKKNNSGSLANGFQTYVSCINYFLCVYKHRHRAAVGFQCLTYLPLDK